jgi:nitrile hydratase accessory protein
MSDDEQNVRVLDAIAASQGIPECSGEPVFREPWEAQAFAMVVALHGGGFFTWNEWADVLSGTIKSAQSAGDPDLGDTYYQHWLRALESIVSKKNLLMSQALELRKEAWREAAARTPHGQPIVLTGAVS